ncbi:hypothetical protein D3C81_1536120 [compost metagenome]
MPASGVKPGATLLRLAVALPLLPGAASARAGEAAAILAGSLIAMSKPAAALRVGWITNESWVSMAASIVTLKPSALKVSG